MVQRSATVGISAQPGISVRCGEADEKVSNNVGNHEEKGRRRREGEGGNEVFMGKRLQTGE